MILGLDISTSITGVTIISEDNEILLNGAWDLRKYKNFFDKASFNFLLLLAIQELSAKVTALENA